MVNQAPLRSINQKLLVLKVIILLFVFIVALLNCILSRNSQSGTSTIIRQHDNYIRRLIIDPKTVEVKSDSGVGNDNRPRGLRILMVGDSILKYQYITLAYYLRYGYWMDEQIAKTTTTVSTPSIINAEGFSSYDEYFTTSNAVLGGNGASNDQSTMELCDCHRPLQKTTEMLIQDYVNSAETERNPQAKMYENRYFYDKERDNLLVYIQAFGSNYPLHLRLWPCLAMNTLYKPDREMGEIEMRDIAPTEGLPTINWEVLIRHMYKHLFVPNTPQQGSITRMMPKYVVMNSNYNFNVADDGSAATLIDTIRNIDMSGDGSNPNWNVQPIWQTSTLTSASTLDHVICNEVKDNCLNVTSLGLSKENIKQSLYLEDNVHYNEPSLYRIMNEQMLEHLSRLEKEQQGEGSNILSNAYTKKDITPFLIS